MEYTQTSPFEAYRNGLVEFTTEQVVARFDKLKRSRILTWFIVVVLGIICMAAFLYFAMPNYEKWIIGITVVAVLLGYSIMDHRLTSYRIIGELTFSSDNLKSSIKEDHTIHQINYSEIVEIKAKPGVPHTLFDRNGQFEEYASLQVIFILRDGSKVGFELETNLWKISKRKKVEIDFVPHLEAVLKDICPKYQIVDKRSQKYGKGWKRN